VNRLTRRRCLGTLLGGTGAALASRIAAAPALGARPGDDERPRLGVIGAGGRATHLMRILRELDRSRIVALCDIYEPRLEAARSLLGGEVETCRDFRRLLDRKDLDAVVIATPDHWHCPMLTAAVEAGKDVYVEKPLSRGIEEGSRAVAAVRATKRVVQVGLQQRSWPHFIRARELVREGRLGKVNLVLCHWYQNYPRTLPPLDFDLSKLDWKAFLGTAPDRPFDPARFRFWRFFWDYAGGILTDLMTHWIDVVHWAMEADAPLTASAQGEREQNEYWETPDTVSASFIYPRKFMATYQGTMNCALTGGGLVFRGERALLELNRDRLAVFPEGKKPAENTGLPEPELAMASDHDGTRDHLQNFLECIRSRKEPSAPVEVGHSSARASHLANLALRSGKIVRWDGAAGRLSD